MERPLRQKAELDWREDGAPVSRRHGEAYFGAADALAEARHVFLGGNDLPERFGGGAPLHVAELGFGTGLNLLATVLAWNGRGVLRYTSFEAYPMTAEEMARALGRWPEFAPLAGPLAAAWAAGERRFMLQGVAVEVIEGDARATLPGLDWRADAWFLDGFSPARNPELWEPGLLREVARHSAPGATLATFSAAGGVRSALAEAGFAVERVPGYGAKKHMTRARLPIAEAPRRALSLPELSLD